MPSPETPRLILASGSPRRQELLREAGYAFVVSPADIDESAYPPGSSPAEIAEHLAVEKARAVAARFPNDVVLAADTVVALRNDALGKPVDAADARRLLSHLAGTAHEVITGVAVIHAAADLTLHARVTSAVHMRRLTAAEMDAYIATGDWQGKAGGYGIQDQDPFVTRMSGCLTNIVGLPMTHTRELLAAAGISPALGRKPHRVALVVDREFGDRLRALAADVHVWACRSPLNEAATKAEWKRRPGYDLEWGISLFNCTPDESPEDMAARIVGDIDAHHDIYCHNPPWSVIDVTGCDPTSRLAEAFGQFGATLTVTKPESFRATRAV